MPDGSCSTEGVAQSCRSAMASEIVPKKALIAGEYREAWIDRVVQAGVQIDLVICGRDGADGEPGRVIAIEECGDAVTLVIEAMSPHHPAVWREGTRLVCVKLEAKHKVSSIAVEVLQRETGGTRTAFGEAVDACDAPVDADERPQHHASDVETVAGRRNNLPIAAVGARVCAAYHSGDAD